MWQSNRTERLNHAFVMRQFSAKTDKGFELPEPVLSFRGFLYYPYCLFSVEILEV